MTKKFILIILTAGIFFLISCNKDTDIFIPDKGELTGPDTSWYKVVTDVMPASKLSAGLALTPHIDSFNINDGSSTINDPAGLQLGFAGHSCVDSLGGALSGIIQTESLLLKKKGDFIRMGASTISDGKLLVTGGAFYMGLKKDGHKLQLAPGSKFNAQFNNDAPSSSMQLFNIDETSTGFNWVKNTDIVNSVSLSPVNQSYQIVSNKLNWVNCSYYYNMGAAQTTTIATDMPRNFTNFTSVVYLVFKNIRSVVALYGDVDNKTFASSSTIPVGLQATVVVISKQGDFYYMGSQDIVTSTPSLSGYQTVSINPARASIDNIKSYLTTL